MLKESAQNKYNNSAFSGKGNNKKFQFKRKEGEKDVCYRYNKGKCSFGATCHYEHKC